MNSFKKNRRGFLLAEETLKIIVAVICMVFLVYILIAVYNSKTSANKIEDAKDILSRIETIVSFLEEGAIESQDVLNPKGWHLYSFVGEEKPNSCLGNNCLCICDNVIINAISSQAKKCDSKGACISIVNLGAPEIDLEIIGAEEPLFIGIRKQNENIYIGELK
jgi:hypothetical protein